MIALLRRNHRYARLWAGESVSMLGDQFTALAIPLIAIALLHASPWQVALLTAASWTPFLFALLVGTHVDRRRSKRRVLVASDLTRAVALATIPVAFLMGWLSIVQLVAVATIVGLAGVVSQTAYMNFFVKVVDSDDMVAANSAGSTSRSAASLAGPPLAGWLITVLSAPIVVVLDCCSYLVSALTLAGLRIDEPEPVRRDTSVFAEAREGLQVLLGSRWLRPILICTTVMNLANFAIIAILLVYASRELHLNAAAIGTAQGIGSAGALIGAIVTTRLARRLGLFRVALIGTVLFSLPFIAVALLPGTLSTGRTVALFAACWVVVAGGITLYDITINSVLVKLIPTDMRGRLVGAFSSINYGIRPIGALLGGVSAEVFGTRGTILAAAVVGSLAVIPLWRSPLRAAHSLDDVPSPQERAHCPLPHTHHDQPSPSA